MIRASLITAVLLASAPQAGAADQLPELVIYTYDSFVSDWGPGPQVEATFEATCACDLKFVAAGDGAALLARIQLEGGRSDADIVLGLDTNLTERARATSLFAPHQLGQVDNDVPGNWIDPIFVPYDWGYFAFVYDNTKLAEPPTSFAALIDAPPDLKIIIQDPRSSTPGLGLLMWVKAIYGADAAEIWQRLAPRILTVTKGWSEAYGMFLEGEAEMVLSYTTSPAYHLIAEGDASKSAAIFDDGHYMQIEVAAMLAHSDQPELSETFLNFMTSEAFQSLIATTNWMYPAVTPPEGLPEGFAAPIPADRALLMPGSQTDSIRDEALEEWLTALSR